MSASPQWSTWATIHALEHDPSVPPNDSDLATLKAILIRRVADLEAWADGETPGVPFGQQQSDYQDSTESNGACEAGSGTIDR